MKKLSTVILCAVLLLSLCLSACGDTPLPSDNDSTTHASTSASTTAQPPIEIQQNEVKTDFCDITATVYSYADGKESVTSKTVQGSTLPNHVPNDDDAKEIINRGKEEYGLAYRTKTPGIHYKYKTEQKRTDKGSYTFDHSLLEKYDTDSLVWSVRFDDFSVNGFSVVDGGVIAFGSDWQYPMEENDCFIVRLDNDGNIIWKETLDFGREREYIQSVLQNEDGSYTVYASGDKIGNKIEYHSVFCKLSSDGKLISFSEKADSYFAYNVKKIDDGYIFPSNSVTILSGNGDPVKRFTYKNEKTDYAVTDALMLDGKLYLSAYAITKGGAADLRDYTLMVDDAKLNDGELTHRTRDRFSAVLLRCDAESGEVLDYCSVKGALGGKLSASGSDGLSWEVENITTTYYSPATSAFSFGGNCFAYRYTFDGDGRYLAKEKLDKITEFTW